ncbi:uncharacterized protein DUF1524 [Kerstersia gyiorum]|uniref:Uncharacterized protein DUF1524 n=1 Tax=Kerstersia gyiorum TaxID=206506 RepID=A0A4Q7MJ45_9BURK|nr:DUF262 domain-containing protein [Kerstersia gyiorum]KAB0541549.1 DUF262 domain-containing protein [Kerstersia gyiorum]RZS67318.1 uncharacterized protein DUF1524 [Kerstersia gyiorum]
MQTELLSLSKAFNEYLYRIPDYQRGYSWGPKQLKDFWNDLGQLGFGQKHYTGVLTLEAVSPAIYKIWEDDLWIIESKNFKPYFVVDGQQRLTTAIILIQSILDHTPEGKTLNYDTVDEVRKRFIFQTRDGGISRSYVFGYEKDNPSYEFLKTKIFKEQSNNHELPEDTIYTYNLQAARDFFDEKLSAMSFAELEEVYTKVSQNMLFNVFTISEDIDVFVTFETMNNRGKPLSHLELLKNRLIYLSTKFNTEDLDSKHDRSRLRKTINECWKSAYHYIGRNPKRRLVDDQFLLLQFILYFNVNLPKSDYAEASNSLGLYAYRHNDGYKDYLLESVFNVRNLYGNEANKSECSDSCTESDEIDIDSDTVFNKVNIELSAEKIHEYALDIKKTVQIYYQTQDPGNGKFSSHEKVLLERIRRFSVYDASVMVVSLYKSKNSLQERVNFLETLERILFFKSFSGWFFRDIDFLEDAARYIAGKKTLAAIGNSMHDICEKFIKSKDFLDALKKFGKNSGYYGWGAVRYFLFEYEQELFAASRSNRSKLDWEEFSKEKFESDYVTIEHIYPQKSSKTQWDARFKCYSVKERNVLKNSIGNLVPLSRQKNSALGNRSFDEKKGSKAKKAGYLYGCYSEIEVAQESEWTAHHIVERGIRLLSFMERRWKLDLGDDAKKIQILGLGFVNTESVNIT